MWRERERERRESVEGAEKEERGKGKEEGFDEMGVRFSVERNAV